MRKLIAAILLSLPVAAFAATQRTAVLDVQNMTCSLCSITIKKALEKVLGVAVAKVDFDQKTVIVEYDPDKASPAALINATTQAGYPSKLHVGGTK